MSFYHAIEKRRWRWIVLAAVLWGVALATKPNALFLPVILGPYLIYVIWLRLRDNEAVLSRSTVVALLFFPLIGIATMFILWPYMLLEFPENVRTHMEFLFRRGRTSGSDWNIMPKFRRTKK